MEKLEKMKKEENLEKVEKLSDETLNEVSGGKTKDSYVFDLGEHNHFTPKDIPEDWK